MIRHTWIVQYGLPDGAGDWEWRDTNYGICETLPAAELQRDWYETHVADVQKTRIIERTLTETVVQ